MARVGYPLPSPLPRSLTAWLVSIGERGWTTRATGMSCSGGSATRVRACAIWSASAGAPASPVVSAARRRRLLADGRPATWLRGLSLGDLGHGGHDLRRHADAARELVRGDLVGGQPETRRLGARAAARVRLRQLPDGVGVASQAAPRDGDPTTRAPGRRGRGRRELLRRAPARRRGPWRHRHAAHRRRHQGDADRLRARPHRPRFRGAHRWLAGLLRRRSPPPSGTWSPTCRPRAIPPTASLAATRSSTPKSSAVRRSVWQPWQRPSVIRSACSLSTCCESTRARSACAS
jgi:hypothetical protein